MSIRQHGPAPAPALVRPLWDGMRILVASVATSVAVIASVHALSPVIMPGTWTTTTTRVVLVVAAVTGVTRWLITRSRAKRDGEFAAPATFLPTAAGAVTGLVALCGLFGGTRAGFSVAAIGPAGFGRLLSRLGNAVDLTQQSVAPIDATLPIALLAVGTAVVIYCLTDFVVAGLRRPACALIFLIVPWMPTLVLVGRVPTADLALVAVSCLVLLAVDNPHSLARRRQRLDRRGYAIAGASRAGVIAAGAAAVTVVCLLATSWGATVPAVASGAWSKLFSATGQSVRLASDLDVRRNLDERSSQVVMRYRTTAAQPSPLRLFTLTSFDGTQWRRGADRTGQSVDGPQSVLWPTKSVDRKHRGTMQITLTALDDSQLPLPLDPRSVDVAGRWSYDPVRDEVNSRGGTSSDLSYRVTIYSRNLTAATLEKARGEDPRDPVYLSLPRTSHVNDIRALARKIVAGSTNRYQQAVALQEYFRDSSRFTYSTKVPRASSDDAVWDFLQKRTGYCVQFATAMTMLARSLGIPSRIGVGFLPGTQISEHEYEVTGKDSHAWPELYFPGQGWVRFEPTPATQSGAAPSWAVPVSSGQTTAADNLSGGQPSAATSTGPAQATSSDAASATAKGSQGATDQSWRWWPVPVGIVLVIGALAGLLGWRRRRTPEPPLDPEQAWSRLEDAVVAAGIEWPVSATPRQIPSALAEQVSQRGGTLPEETVEALHRITAVVEDERYARVHRYTATEEELATWIATVAAGIRQALTSRPARDDDPTVARAG